MGGGVGVSGWSGGCGGGEALRVEGGSMGDEAGEC